MRTFINFFSSPIITIFIKSRRVRWARNVARMKDFDGKTRRKEASRKK
jgi:hypothetical protein